MNTHPLSLDHERLDVHRCAIELRDQWKRAAMSIALNIAEGGGKPSEADRARFRAIARSSAMECGALLDVVCAGFRHGHGKGPRTDPSVFPDFA